MGSASVWWKVLLAAAFAAAVALRLYGLGERGIFYHDEGMYVALAKYHSGLLQTFLTDLFQARLSSQSLLEKADALWLEGGTPWMRAHALHEYSLIALFTVFSPTETLNHILITACSLLTFPILLGFTWSRKQGETPSAGRWVGVIAALLLAFSVWDLHSSRSGLSQSMSLLVTCLTLRLAWEIPAEKIMTVRRLVGIGVLTGLAFTTHYNLFWLPLLMAFWVGWCDWKRKAQLREWIRNSAWLGAGMLFPLLVFEAPHRLLRGWFTGRPFAPYYELPLFRQIPSYIEQVFHQVFYWEKVGPQPPLNPLFLPSALWELEGPFFSSLLLLGVMGLVLRMRSRDPRAWLLLAWATLPYAIWTAFGYAGLRSFFPMLLPLCIGCASLLVELGAGMKKRMDGALWHGGVLSLFVLLVAIQAPRLWPLAQTVSPWKQMAEAVLRYEQKHGPVRIADAELSDRNRIIYRYYLGARIDRTVPRSRFLLVDPSSQDQRWNKNPRVYNALENSVPVIRMDLPIQKILLSHQTGDPWFEQEYFSGRFGHAFALYDLGHGEETQEHGEVLQP